MMGNGSGAGMAWMWVLWPLVIIATVAVVALLVRSGADRSRASGPVDHPPAHETDEPTPPPGQSPARRILDERYARGEIDEEDYRARRRRLEEPDA